MTKPGESVSAVEITRDEPRKIAVIGAGVIGLTSAIRLREQGHQVHVVAKDLPGDRRMVSEAAAAFWEPFLSSPDARFWQWGKDTFDQFTRESTDPSRGIMFVKGLSMFREPGEDPEWHNYVDYRRATPDELPDFTNWGYWVNYPVVEMTKYMPNLLEQFRQAGGTVDRRVIQDVSQLTLEGFHSVVNCTGLGSRELVGDKLIYPVRGQLVRMAKPAEFNTMRVDDYNPSGMRYVVPRSEDVIFGGTGEVGVESTEPDPTEVEAIVRRCRELVPELEKAPVLSAVAGLRPRRDPVRLEEESLAGGGKLIHNYGHGGSGVTFSWGCANDVLAHLKR